MLLMAARRRATPACMAHVVPASACSAKPSAYVAVRGRVTTTSTVAYGGYFTATGGVGVYGASDSNNGVYGNRLRQWPDRHQHILVWRARCQHQQLRPCSAPATSSVGVRGTSRPTTASMPARPAASAAMPTPAAVRPRSERTTTRPPPGTTASSPTATCWSTATSPAPAPAWPRWASRPTAAKSWSTAIAGTQSVISDQGTATLKDGRAVIKIDPLFAQTVNLERGLSGLRHARLS